MRLTIFLAPSCEKAEGFAGKEQEVLPRNGSNRCAQFEYWLEGTLDTKERQIFGLTEYLVGTVTWLLTVEQIFLSFESGSSSTARRWIFDGKEAARECIGKNLIRGGLCNWLKLAIAHDDQSAAIPYRDGDLGLMVFGPIEDKQTLRKDEVFELADVKVGLDRKVRPRWPAGGFMLISKKTNQIEGLLGGVQIASAAYYAPSVTFGAADLQDVRELGKLWSQEVARWREMVLKWDMASQNVMIFGQKQSKYEHVPNHIVAAFLSVDGGKVNVTTRKTLAPFDDMDDHKGSILCIS